MKKQNILFVCKHNVFRSKIAEAYFKKVNRNEEINVKSAGIIKADTLRDVQKKIINFQRKTAKELGIDVLDSSNQLSISLLKGQDIIIIVADDVPKEIFSDPFYLKPNLRVIVWEIPDVKGDKDDGQLIREDIKTIMKKVDEFSEELK